MITTLVATKTITGTVPMLNGCRWDNIEFGATREHRDVVCTLIRDN